MPTSCLLGINTNQQAVARARCPAEITSPALGAFKKISAPKRPVAASRKKAINSRPCRPATIPKKVTKISITAAEMAIVRRNK
jgi:hypothetical protein